ncbi:MAG: tRNA (cytidine(34)-2'-O)-methyltransferase, partial [Deltaproteobacteria bacterium]|nr:tRNA (cytidine(34)-2'-O)-methyltransferase [Deltaproteobacteria bacterium]
WYMSKKAERTYTQVDFRRGDFLVFGKETLGLPEKLLDTVGQQALRIPILSPAVRSLNLANSAAIILYEALRQTEQL